VTLSKGKVVVVEDSRKRVAVVLGAAGVTGRAVCRRLAHDGFFVVLADAMGLDDAQQSLADIGGQLLGSVVVDLRDEGSVQAAKEQIERLSPAIDSLVIVAGVLQDASAATDLDAAEWDRVMSVNLRGPFLATKWLTPLLEPGARSTVVTVGSWWGYEGHAFFSAYCASKAGLRVFTQALAEELAPSGIRVNLVAPGNIDTPMHHRALQAEADARGVSLTDMQTLEWSKIPLGAPAQPDQIAAAIGFLVGDDSSYMTGSVVDVNGGVVFR
jgi:NAD(P)-dependent dehydrogenase (short-subunit alcohol dehydrogenase family)